MRSGAVRDNNSSIAIFIEAWCTMNLKERMNAARLLPSSEGGMKVGTQHRSYGMIEILYLAVIFLVIRLCEGFLVRSEIQKVFE